MGESFTLTRASLVRLLDRLGYPNPDDPDSPIGPNIRTSYSELLWSMLNPQPLPPIAGPFPEPWRRLAWVLLNPQPLPPRIGPHPEPWRSALLARAVIDNAVAQYRRTEMMTSGAEPEMAAEAARTSVREFVDDYCGNVPPRWPRPWPWPLTADPTPRDPMELLVAGAQFQRASEAVAGTPLQEDFAAAADQLFEIGLRRLEEG